MGEHAMKDWGTAIFDNQDSLDWVEAFAQAPSEGALRRGLELPAAGAGPDAQQGHRLLAAAEVVAAWRGQPSPELPVSLTSWLMGRSVALDGDLVRAALRAVDRVGEGGGLRDHWRGRGRLTAWESVLQDLARRLGRDAAG